MNNAILLCPFWARFVQRPDGYWMAYCSKAACDEMEEKRPGFLTAGDFPRSDKCLVGYGEYSAEVMPVIIKGIGDTVVTYFSVEHVDEAYWGSLVDGFIEWVPVVPDIEEMYAAFSE